MPGNPDDPGGGANGADRGGAGGAHDDPKVDEAVDGGELIVLRVPRVPPEPSASQIAEHELTGHAVYRSWCCHRVASKGALRRSHWLWRRRVAGGRCRLWLLQS